MKLVRTSRIRSSLVFCHHRQSAWLGSTHFLSNGISPTSDIKSLKTSEPTCVAQADLEDLVLSGKLFNRSRSGSFSPRQSPSPDAAKWQNDEYADNYSDDDGSPNPHASAKSNHPGVHGSGVVSASPVERKSRESFMMGTRLRRAPGKRGRTRSRS